MYGNGAGTGIAAARRQEGIILTVRLQALIVCGAAAVLHSMRFYVSEPIGVFVRLMIAAVISACAWFVAHDEEIVGN